MPADHITAVRKVLSFGMLLALAACGSPMRWDKAGTDEKATANDLSYCRRAAREEAFRAYPFFGAPYPSHRWWGWGGSPGADQFYAENRLTDFCMRNKGYALVPVQPQTQPPPAPTPSSPEPPAAK